MDFFSIFFGTLCAYAIGSIPTSILISKFAFGIDIREHGSGTASHVNSYRVMGWKASLMGRIIDISKGLMAAQLAYLLCTHTPLFSQIEYPALMMTFGLAAVLGHIFSVFAKFRGGKGVHCAIGVLLAFNLPATLVCIGIGILVFLISRYPNLGYVMGSFSLPVYVLLTKNRYEDELVPMFVFSLILFIIIFITHYKNLRDILNGDEMKSESKLFDSI